MSQSHPLKSKRNRLLLDSNAPNWVIRPMPQEAVSLLNPMFRMEARRLPSVDDLRRKTLRQMSLIVGGFVFVWLVGTVIMFVSGSVAGRYWYETMLRLIGYMFLGSLADKFIFDFIGIASGLNLIREEVTQHRWDLLNLSSIRTQDIVKSKQAVAEINGWNALSWVMGIRLAVVILIFLHIIVLPIVMSMLGESMLASIIDFRYVYINLESFMFAIAWFVTYCLAGFVFVVEPRWRLRALAAAGLAFSAQKRDLSLSMLSGMSAFLQIWAAQVFIAIGSMVIMGILGQFLLVFGTFGGLVGGIVYVSLIGMFIHGVYQGMARSWMNKTWRTLYRRRGTF